MSRRDLRPLPEGAKTRIELVKLDHLKGIREVMRGWHTTGSKSKRSPPKLTCRQQQGLQDLVVAMGVHLGKEEGTEYLAVTGVLQQFESDVHKLMSAIAGEAQDLFNQLIAEFHVEGCQNGHDSDPRVTVHHRVSDGLKPTVDDLIIQAVEAHRQRLKAKCTNPPWEGSATASAEARPPEKSPGSPGRHIDRKQLAERVEKLRIARGLSAERLAHEAHLDKKTVIGIHHGRRDVRMGTLESLAHALGVSIAELISG
jgi:DNA-binding XRE family transcriptional regulator